MMFNVILQVMPVPQQRSGYGVILLLVLIVFVVYIAIKHFKILHIKESFTNNKSIRNNLYRKDTKHTNDKEIHRMLKQEHSITKENLYSSTNNVGKNKMNKQ